MSYYPKLSEIKYLPLSVGTEKVKRFLIGKWIVFKENGTYTEKNRIEFGEDNKIINSTIEKWRSYGKPDWSFEDHKFDNFDKFNYFNVNGMSTMEMIYIDENLIYARGHADIDIIFIKEDSIGLFNNIKEITTYLFNKERYWVNINNAFNEKHHNKDIKESFVAFWILLTLTSVFFIPTATKQSGTVKVELLLLVSIVIAIALAICYKLRQKTILKKLITQYKDTDTAVLLKARLSGKY